MAVRPADGTLFVADEAGRVLALPDAHHHGQADQVAVVAQGLDHPSSLAFFGDWLYVGETARITRLHLPPNGLTPDAQEVVVPNLPPDGEHLTRTVVIGPDARLYIGVGSSCNVCVEADPHRAAILVANLDGSALQVYASGLRNAVGLAFAPGTTQLWATVNGRDNLGDHLPPDDLRQISPGGFYGWPYCYDGPHPNPEFNDPARCAGVPPDELALPAHVAPLGLSFGQGLQAPVAYQQSLYIAEHGSWNSSVPVGYQLLRVPLVQGGLGEPVVFASGWLPSGGGAGAVWGRPVGVTVGSDGALYVSDDANGVIYRIVFTG
jgi:glucose/arabinose dehydrogenase